MLCAVQTAWGGPFQANERTQPYLKYLPIHNSLLCTLLPCLSPHPLTYKSDCNMRPSFRALPVEVQIPGALKGQRPPIALRQHPIFRAGDRKFYPVSALHLKSCVIAGSGMGMVHLVSVMMVGNGSAPGYHGGWDRQFR